MEEYDIVFFNYLTNAWGFAEMGCMARKHKKKMVMDIDDNIWNILPDNPVYETWKRGGEYLGNLTAMCNEVDHITTTNTYLRNAIMAKTAKKAEQISVLPNRIDLDETYSYRKPFKDEKTFVIAHFGSTTHFKSLVNDEFVEGMDKIMKRYPNVTFRTVGSFFPQFKDMWGLRYDSVEGHPDLMTWVKKRMPEVLKDVDLMVVPLADNVYNRCKSSIKFIEASSVKIPGCWQDIRQYREVIRDGYNGMLCKSSKDWYKGVKTLLEDPPLRKKMGEFAFKTVKKDWQMKDNIQPYIDLFQRIV
jgi:glycosyltransferase involved in cell wall biosynthesis